MVFDLSDLMPSNLRLDLIAVDLIPEMGLYMHGDALKRNANASKHSQSCSI